MIEPSLNRQKVKEIFICELNSYIDSSGVAGEIPSTFAKLQDMKVM